MRTGYYSLLLVSLLGLLAPACRHQKKGVSGVQKSAGKSRTTKSPVVHHPAAKGPASNSASDALREKLGLTSKEIKNSKLYSFISEWYGVPYKYSGCQKTGVDCSCFTNILYERVYGKKIARTAGEMYNACDKISPQDAREGDLFFFKIGGNAISHVGVFLKNHLFVHSSTSRGVVVSSVEEAYYKKYFYCAGKLRNV